MESLAIDDPFTVEAPTSTDYLRAAEIVHEYADFPSGGSDASVIVLAERFVAFEVATLDHRHFTVVKPKHVDTLALVP